MIVHDSIDSKTAFGDLLNRALFRPSTRAKMIWGVGPVISAPVGADRFSSNDWPAVPAAVAQNIPGHWMIGALVHLCAKPLGSEPPAEVPATGQEWAWSSPVWYAQGSNLRRILN